MFEKLNNSAKVEFELLADGPVLISSGRSHKTDPTMPDTTFMTGYCGKDHTEECYVIPGSTIKGVLRHYLQDYYNFSDSDAGILFGRIPNNSNRSPAQKSKVKFNDAFADPATIRTAVRNSTKINPLTQAPVGGSLNNMEAIEAGVFKASFSIRNFTNKEMSSLLNALRDINTGAVRFGGRVSRGFGQMKLGSFSLTANEGYNNELKPKNPAVFSDIEEAIKHFTGVN